MNLISQRQVSFVLGIIRSMMESMEKKCLRKSEEIVLSSAVIKIQIFSINLLLFFVKYRVYESLISIFNNNDIFNIINLLQ